MNLEDNSLFYCDIEETSNKDLISLIEKLKQFSEEKNKQVYIIKKALGVKKPYEYELDSVVYLLVPKHPIMIINYGEKNEELLEDYYYDFKEDLGHLSDKYNYDKILGRIRKWNDEWLQYTHISDLDIENFINEEIEKSETRKIDLLISLLIGSINSIDKIGIDDPVDILDIVKQKIVLFDGQQSRFIYQPIKEKRVTIQGMAGTGKTELLLHKLKEIYGDRENTSIAFTCYNKVLANDMKNRIPKFFNFMKVDEQIDWENRLHVFSSWGSYKNPESGLYSYICNNYGIPFSNYMENRDFDDLCLKAIKKLEELECFEPCFDYLFIDESQDFGENFFKLCEKITRTSVYIAGDIFQNIYDNVEEDTTEMSIKPNFLLNKCYRTDPKTLMLAHAIGMGLYESPPLNWLEDADWISCGYEFNRREKRDFVLSRTPLRRFEDLEETNTMQLLTSNDDQYTESIIGIIDELREKNKNIAPEDIGIVIIGRHKSMCEIADSLTFEISDRYGWKCSKGYETKIKSHDKVYISNINNIKGLEFPFIICAVLGYISDNIKYRNSIYMALTRSFLTSYFIVNDINKDFVEMYSNAIDDITKTGIMNLIEPTKEEKADMENKIKISLLEQSRNLIDILDELFAKEYPNLKKNEKEMIYSFLEKIKFNRSEESVLKKARALIEEVMEAE